MRRAGCPQPAARQPPPPGRARGPCPTKNTIVGRGPCAPPRSTEVLLPTAVGADARIGPPFGRDASSDLRRGAASPTPRDRCKRSYISKYERQRRRMADNTAFRPRPTENPANQPERKSRNHWFLAAFFGYFLSLVKESSPPAAYISRFSLPFPH